MCCNVCWHLPNRLNKYLKYVAHTMIIDLRIKGKTILVLGSGSQAERRVHQILDEHANIVVVALSATSDKILEWSREGRIHLITNCDIQDASLLDKYKPDLLIATTDDHAVNEMLLNAAKSYGVLAYRSDSYDESDYAHPAVLRFDGDVSVAVFTGGQSPIVSKYIRRKVKDALVDVITPSILAKLSIQDMARKEAKSKISSQIERKKVLDRIMYDKAIDRLIRDGEIKDAKERAMFILGDKQ